MAITKSEAMTKTTYISFEGETMGNTMASDMNSFLDNEM